MLVHSPHQNAAIVACMEDILDLYQQPFNDSLPIICMDEKTQQLLCETKASIPMKPGEPQKVDFLLPTRKAGRGVYLKTNMLHLYVYGTFGRLAACSG